MYLLLHNSHSNPQKNHPWRPCEASHGSIGSDMVFCCIALCGAAGGTKAETAEFLTRKLAKDAGFSVLHRH